MSPLCRLFFFLSTFICFFFSSARPLPFQGNDSTKMTEFANEKGRHSYLWTVRHPSVNGTVHLFGYLRVPAFFVWPFVFQEVKRQFSASDIVVFESDDEGIESLAKCIRRKKKSEAADTLSVSLRERLGEFFRHNKQRPPIFGMEWAEMPAEWLLPSMLHVLSNRELSSVANGSEIEMDSKLREEAEKGAKQLAFVEHVPELCDYLPSLGRQQLEFGISHLIDELQMTEKADDELLKKSSTRTSIGLYNCGKFEAEDDLIGRAFLSPGAKAKTEKLSELNKRLISDIFSRRNERWIARIVQLIEQNSQKRTFFAFGISHLLGNGSIVQLLRLRGYSVDEQQFEPNGKRKETENAIVKINANQQKTDTGKEEETSNSLFWTLFAVAIAIPCAFALFGVIKYTEDCEQKDKSQQKGGTMQVNTKQNGHFDTSEKEEGQMDKSEMPFDQNGHFDSSEKEEGQMDKNGQMDKSL